jgi:hypothetical protein
MASIIKHNNDDFSYAKCPFEDITGCEYMMIIKGYCMAGHYCIQDCAYAWSSVRNDA